MTNRSETGASTDGVEAIHPATTIGHVALKVADLDRAIAFYRNVLGFDLVRRLGDGAVFLAVGDYHHHLALITWDSQGGAPPPPGSTGLHHVAIRYPNRRELARAVRRLLDHGLTIDSAADHGVNEAIYLRDPDGHGLELNHDRDREEWPRDVYGAVISINEPLDVHELLAEIEPVGVGAGSGHHERGA